MSRSFARSLNALGLLAVCVVLLYALYDQLVYSDLPCPLCLLQRVGFTLVGFGLCLNVIYGPRPQHYAIMILSAAFGLTVAVRQMFLHIVPGSGSYGDPFLGLHFYTWSAIVFFVVIVGSALMMMFDDQFEANPAREEKFGGQMICKVAFFSMLVLTAGNAVSAFLECGPLVCADNPVSYRLLDGDTAQD